ncbi:MAG: hypothetical protein Q7U34_07075 [Anaerolineales bacterium]|nr:hypothetical protein [Anaerolineales bacterium]MDP3184956.1 hypothetical protein [Anaerolineales bacterium]
MKNTINAVAKLALSLSKGWHCGVVCQSEGLAATSIIPTGEQTPTSPARISSIINWVNPLRPGISLPVSCPQGKGTAQRAEEVGKSERRPVMGRIGVVPFGNITPRESGLTSNGSFFAR